MEFEIAIVLLCSLGFLVGAAAVLRRALVGAEACRRIVRVATGLFLAWWVSVVSAAWLGMFEIAPTGGFPKFLVGWVPAFAAMALWATSTRARGIVDRLSPVWLVGFQTFRLVGVAMLWGAWRGDLPPVFAVPAGIGGVLTGLTAPWVAWALFRTRTDSVKWAKRWNALGLADIAVAVVLGGLSGPGPDQILSVGFPSSAAMAFPLVVTPAFLIPLALLGHFAVWRTLRLRP